jgi:hypothetical protein
LLVDVDAEEKDSDMVRFEGGEGFIDQVLIPSLLFALALQEMALSATH